VTEALNSTTPEKPRRPKRWTKGFARSWLVTTADSVQFMWLYVYDIPPELSCALWLGMLAAYVGCVTALFTVIRAYSLGGIVWVLSLLLLGLVLHKILRASPHHRTIPRSRVLSVAVNGALVSLTYSARRGAHQEVTFFARDDVEAQRIVRNLRKREKGPARSYIITYRTTG
jgi:hypothetical protein